MHDRTALGPADVSDHDLERMVAASYGVAREHVILCDSAVDEVAYDLDAITTAGRYWVRGSALVCGMPEPYRFFVKHMQAWNRSPLFEQAAPFIPPELLEWAITSLPWRTEALAYRSDLATRLPEGLTAPRAFEVRDLDESSAAVWLEAIDAVPAEWDLDRYRHAAYLIGRLAASASLAPLGDVGRHSFTVQDYADGRLKYQIIPTLRDEAVWRHPLVSGAFDADLRERLLTAADRAQELAGELGSVPLLTSHSDACPNNLLVRRGHDGFVLIDYALWSRMPAGFDLGQLLVGDVQTGRRTAADLAQVEATILPSYVDGLRAEGCDIAPTVVARSHALALLLFTGLSTLPFDHLGSPPSPEVTHIARQRAAIARFSLDLLETTA